MFNNLKILFKRFRHRRGHGVHSPYIYNIVRNVFMLRNVDIKQTLQNNEFFKALVDSCVESRTAMELCNLYIHCGYHNFEIDPVVEITSDVNFIVCTDRYSVQNGKSAIKKAIEVGATIAVVRKSSDKDRGAICSDYIKAHRSTTVDRGGYVLFFNNHLPKQHFVL